MDVPWRDVTAELNVPEDDLLDKIPASHKLSTSLDELTCANILLLWMSGEAIAKTAPTLLKAVHTLDKKEHKGIDTKH